MNLRLTAAEIYIPRRLRDGYFRRLFALTARAFEAGRPRLDGLSFVAIRREFARFTVEQTGRFPAGDSAAVEAKRRLREAAHDFGKALRRDLRLRSPAEVMRAGRLLYRILGIDFQGSASGEIKINACFFASHYSPQTCAFIAALDEGVLTGLAGGGRLEFTERITEHRPCCRARFLFPSEPA